MSHISYGARTLNITKYEVFGLTRLWGFEIPGAGQDVGAGVLLGGVPYQLGFHTRKWQNVYMYIYIYIYMTCGSSLKKPRSPLDNVAACLLIQLVGLSSLVIYIYIYIYIYYALLILIYQYCDAGTCLLDWGIIKAYNGKKIDRRGVLCHLPGDWPSQYRSEWITGRRNVDSWWNTYATCLNMKRLVLYLKGYIVIRGYMSDFELETESNHSKQEVFA